MPSWWKAIVREPLVHFLLIGAAVFAVDHWRTPEPVEHAPPVEHVAAHPKPADPRIVVDASVLAKVTAAAELHHGRAPTQAEIATELERWIDEEVLFREALARGLERDDPMIHERIASRMSYVLEQAAIIPEPTDAQLRAWFDAHREAWIVPDRIDFTHVFVAKGDPDPAARLDQLAKALAAGAPPARLGDTFSGGHRYRGRRLADLAQSFGDEFVDGIAKQPPGTWVKRTSRHGVHLVRIELVAAGHGAAFEQARLDVRKAWRENWLREEMGTAVQRLRARWEIVR